MRTLPRDADSIEPSRDEVIPQLIVLLECDRPTAGSSRHALQGLSSIELGRGSRRQAQRHDGVLRLTVPDARMSGKHARIAREGSRWVARDLGSTNGIFVDGERRDQVALSDGIVLEIGHTLFLFREAALDGPFDLDSAEIGVNESLRTFVPVLARRFRELVAVAPTSAAILLQGETGTGKEVVARAVHELAGRRGAFVAVNCGAIANNLVESELFGYVRGAFSGADQDRPGLVRSADGGTLFLDEIADLPAASQAALLRVLQEREVTPVGGTQPISVDLRLLAASHVDLDEHVSRGLFRRDLYARIAGFTLRLPPLRERREDLGILLAALLRRGSNQGVRLSCAAARAIADHEWPLNVRELASCLSVAVALAGGDAVKVAHLPETLRPQPAEPDAPLAADDLAHRDELEGLLRQHAGNVSAIARATGKARAQIHRWLRRYRLEPERYRGH